MGSCPREIAKLILFMHGRLVGSVIGKSGE